MLLWHRTALMWRLEGDRAERPHVAVLWDMAGVVTQTDFDAGVRMVQLARECWPLYTLCLVVVNMESQVRALPCKTRFPHVAMSRRLLSLRSDFVDFVARLELGYYDLVSRSSIDAADTSADVSADAADGSAIDSRARTVLNEVSVVHCDGEEAAAAFVVGFTRRVMTAGSRLHELEKQLSMPFSMPVVRQRTNKTPESTWLAVLAQVPDVSDRKAAAVAAKYPSLHCLMLAYARMRTPTERARMLVGIPGIGPTLSAKIYEAFCGAPDALVGRRKRG